MPKPIKTIKSLKLPTKIPTLSLCVIFRDNIDTIEPLLNSIRNVADEYVFTDTGSTDGTRSKIQHFLKSAKGKITDFEWCDDFAKARQANFQAATGRWRMFLDSDDVLVGGETLRNFIHRLDTEAPQIAGAYISYDYDIMEELNTMRLARWDCGWYWSDSIHERMVADRLPENAIAKLNPEQVCVRHRRKDQKQKDTALRRNAVIARREYALTTDVEYKARLARTIAMEMKLDGKFDEAMPYLEEVGNVYGAIPEGKQAFADLARFAGREQNFQSALQFAKKAGPSYEAIAYSAMGDDLKCIEAQNRGAAAGQQTTHEGFIFEQIIAPACQAKAALNAGYHPASADKVLNRIRTDHRELPEVKPLVSEIRGFIDRITILVPGTPQPFDGSSTGAMLGGSEEAVVYLSRALAKLGRNVRVFGVLPPLSIPGIDADGVEYLPFKDFRLEDEHGCLVVWRSLGLVENLIHVKSQIVQAANAGDEKAAVPSGIGRSSLWLHDQDMRTNQPDYINKLLKSINSVIVLSDHHRKCIERELPKDHEVNFVKLSNGIVGDDFARLDWSKRDPNRVIYSSCPSRGLLVLLDAWPQIKAACPEAYLDIYYDWSMIARDNPELHKGLMLALETLKDQDVVHHGGVGHAELYEALVGANVWAYSHFHNTNVETFCISAVKATAAGCQVITAPNGALPEVAPLATFITDPEDYAAAVIAAIQDPMSDEIRRHNAEAAVETFDWESVAQRFSEVWTTRQPNP